MRLSVREEKKQSLGFLRGSSPSKPHPCFNPTCSHKQDPSSQDDVPLAFVKAAGGHADSAEQQQDGAEDGEDAGGSHHACPGGGRDRVHVSHLDAQANIALLPPTAWTRLKLERVHSAQLAGRRSAPSEGATPCGTPGGNNSVVETCESLHYNLARDHEVCASVL